MPLVYSYYHPVPALTGHEEHRLIMLWKNSWRRVGFIPVLLSHQHAEAHPLHDAVAAKIDQFPSINPPGYDRACWLRWLAFAQVGGGLITDYDVIAWAFEEGDLAQAKQPINVLDPGGVPCAVYATKAGAEEIVRDILSHEHLHDAQHYSDMYFFQARNYPKVDRVVLPFGHPDWRLAPAVHFSHSDTGRERPNLKRFDVIRKEMSL